MKHLTTLLLILFICVPSSAQQVRYDNLPDLAEFVVNGRKWDNTDLTYYFLNGTNDLPGNSEQQAIQDAFDLWANVTPLTFTEASSASSADIVILWGVGSHGDGFPFDGTGGALAHAFYPPPNGGSIAGDAHFDDAETWTLSTRSSSTQPIDLMTVAAHEFGHSLGLGHSQVTGALMYPYYTGSHRYLSQDDINGIQNLYGSPPTPVTATILGPDCVEPGIQKTWTGQGDQGFPPYGYQWYRECDQIGFGPTCEDGWEAAGYGQNYTYTPSSTENYFQLKLRVTDTKGDADETTEFIDVGYHCGGISRPQQAQKQHSRSAGASLVADVPDAYALDANYPNPFNPSTQIRFALPEATLVSLVVYDMMGREVTRLLDRTVEAGVHQVTWSADDLPSGTYVYRLETRDFAQTRIMTLLK